MKSTTYIRHLIRYSKIGLFFLLTIICGVLHVDLLMDLDKPVLQHLEIEEAFDPLEVRTLHPDSTIYRTMYV